jgi:eukaryotic translation initiation factor 2C
MEPNLKYPFNTRSFFTSNKKKDIDVGLELWQGYFQSLRPSQNKLYINIDISTGVMYKSTDLIRLCLEYVRRNNPGALGNIPDRERMHLQRFISNLRVETNYARRRRVHVVKKISRESARTLMFSTRDGTSMSVETYFRSLNITLTQPLLPCVEVPVVFDDSIQNANHPTPGWTWRHDSNGAMHCPSRTTYEETIS